MKIEGKLFPIDRANIDTDMIIPAQRLIGAGREGLGRFAFERFRFRADGGEIGYVPAAELFHFERQSIRDHGGYARSLAAIYNRGLHHRRWAADIAALMARPAFRAGAERG